LTASVNLSSNTPIIECKGKLMLSSQFRSTTRGNVKGHSPFVFFYQLGEIVEIALDEKTYGNDSRFCRRSTNYNAELRHVVDKGSLHLFIVSVKSVDKNQEILLPLENSVDSNPAPLPSINADLREIKKPANGLLNTSTDDEPLASRDIKERKKKERKKAKRFLPTTNEESPIASRKTRAQHQTLKSPNPEVEVKTEVKEEIEEKVSPVKLEQPKPIIKEEEESFSDNEKPPIVNGRDEHHQSPHEHQEPQPTEMLSPIKGHHHKTSPSGGASKLGLPDNKGLIVGVNTINYDASSSVRNKAKVINYPIFISAIYL
jgi:histone-lysine N-methyltransferase MLL5